MRSRDSSTTRRACRPEACSEEGLPTCESCSTISATASGCIGVVAAWSRYTVIVGQPTGSGRMSAGRARAAVLREHPQRGTARL